MRRTLLALGFCFFVIAASAQASYISLNTSLSTKVDGNKLLVLVQAENKGDESAFNVQAEVKVGGQKMMGEKREELPVNGRYQAQFSVPLALSKPGTYPLTLLLHYTDANQYPFSALTCKTFNFRSADSPLEIFGKMTVGSFWKSGEVKLTYKNLSETGLNLTLYLVTPRELSAGKEKVTVKLPVKSEQVLALPLENFSALSGSNYQIFAIAEYERQGIHQTAIIPGMVKIVESKTLLGLDFNLLLIILAVLLLVFIGAQFYRKK
jgi:hypothetical protein